MRLVVVLLCLMLGGAGVHAQSTQDTLLLPEITIIGNDPEAYLPGGKLVVINTDTLALQDMSQILAQKIPVYFIQYGAPGQLSSINLRGLGASRTSLLWQGMEINSFTLGQTDFGELSAGVADELKIQQGAVGPLYGNGALGGTVELTDDLNYDGGHHLLLNTLFGSYGFRGANLGYRYASNRFASSTKLFRREAKNDFRYRLGTERQRQRNAGFLHYGMVQNFRYSLNPNHQLSFHFWLNNYFREIQPNKFNLNASETLESENIRMALKWQWSSNHSVGKLQLGYTDDSQLYDQSELTRVYRWFASLENEWQIKQHTMLRVGANINYLLPEVDAYRERTTETRSDAYASARWTGINNLSLGLSFRAPMINGEVKKFLPILSAKYHIHKNAHIDWSADFQMGTSYRLPTLNDHYWQPGGNENLRPEYSRNLELGTGLSIIRNSLRWDLEVRGFRHEVDNWIIWIPGGRDEGQDGEVISFWFPDNIREVLAYGIQYQTSVAWQTPVEHLSSALEINGTYNKSLNKKSISPVDRSIDKQLPYTPKNVLNLNWVWKYHTWHVGVVGQYRSERYVETNNELPPLDPYTLWNIALGKRGNHGPVDWKLELLVNNITGEHYETFENRAMPGRNYHLNLSINFIKEQNETQ